MTAQLIDGNSLSKQLRAQVAADTAALKAKGVDAHAFVGLKLDGGRGHAGTGLLPVDNDGRSEILLADNWRCMLMYCSQQGRLVLLILIFRLTSSITVAS